MDARVSGSSRWMTVTAFGGHEYIRDEWRVVPAGCEEEAMSHPFLEIMVPDSVFAVLPEPAAKTGGRKGAKGAEE